MFSHMFCVGVERNEGGVSGKGGDEEPVREYERWGVLGACVRSERVAMWSSEGRRSVLSWMGRVCTFMLLRVLCVRARGRTDVNRRL